MPDFEKDAREFKQSVEKSFDALQSVAKTTLSLLREHQEQLSQIALVQNSLLEFAKTQDAKF